MVFYRIWIELYPEETQQHMAKKKLHPKAEKLKNQNNVLIFTQVGSRPHHTMPLGTYFLDMIFFFLSAGLTNNSSPFMEHCRSKGTNIKLSERSTSLLWQASACITMHVENYLPIPSLMCQSSQEEETPSHTLINYSLVYMYNIMNNVSNASSLDSLIKCTNYLVQKRMRYSGAQVSDKTVMGKQF